MECLGMWVGLSALSGTLGHLNGLYPQGKRERETNETYGMLLHATHGSNASILPHHSLHWNPQDLVDDTCRHCNHRKLNGFYLMRCCDTFRCSQQLCTWKENSSNAWGFSLAWMTKLALLWSHDPIVHLAVESNAAYVSIGHLIQGRISKVAW